MPNNKDTFPSVTFRYEENQKKLAKLYSINKEILEKYEVKFELHNYYDSGLKKNFTRLNQHNNIQISSKIIPLLSDFFIDTPYPEGMLEIIEEMDKAMADQL